MKATAIAAAKVRLERARPAVERLERMGFNFTDLESAWWSFLLAASGVYGKLEQGSKGHGPSEGWFGRVKHQRKADELLSYIHHARNSEEHSIEGSAQQEKMSLVAHSKETKLVRDGQGNVTKVIHPVGVPISLQAIAPYLRLVRVTDSRFGDAFDPPTSHLGQSLPDSAPATVARAGLTYLERLIAEAEALPAH